LKSPLNRSGPNGIENREISAPRFTAIDPEGGPGPDTHGRSLKKGPYVVERLLEKVYRADSSGSREPIKTWARACTIVPEFVGKNFAIHNGRNFIKLYVTEDMVGHKLGEFAPTRTFKGHGGKSTKGRK
jgi:small subunit ribosomal protein S19